MKKRQFRGADLVVDDDESVDFPIAASTGDIESSKGIHERPSLHKDFIRNVHNEQDKRVADVKGKLRKREKGHSDIRAMPNEAKQLSVSPDKRKFDYTSVPVKLGPESRRQTSVESKATLQDIVNHQQK